MAIFDFVQSPIIPGVQQDGSMNSMSYAQQQQQYNQFQQMQQQTLPAYAQPPAPTPTISGGYGFSVKPDDDEPQPKNPLTLQVPVDVGIEEVAAAKKRGRRKKAEVATVNSSDIVKVDGAVEDTSVINTYAATNMLLNNTLEQLDMLAAEVKAEFDQVRTSRTMKGKYNYLVGLSANLSSIIGTKATVIREINNSISKANDLDYKKQKDFKSAADQQNDDKYLMDLYNAFITNPMGMDNNKGMLGPTPVQTTINGTSIVRAPMAGNQQLPEGQPMDMGYLNYLSNVTPEQNMMFYEQDPNVKQCVVFDASTGNKFFQVMNIATGQAIPNVPNLDNRFMEDTTIDLKNRIAKNNNLHDTYPVIVINENITKEY